MFACLLRRLHRGDTEASAVPFAACLCQQHAGVCKMVALRAPIAAAGPATQPRRQQLHAQVSCNNCNRSRASCHATEYLLAAT